MKRHLNISYLAILTLLCVSCSTSCTTRIDPGSDPLVVRAESLMTVALTTFDTFLAIEYNNKEIIKDRLPEIHKAAEWLRGSVDGNIPRGLAFIESLNKVKNAYKQNKTTEGKMSLATTIALVETMLREVQGSISKLGSTITLP